VNNRGHGKKYVCRKTENNERERERERELFISVVKQR